MPTLKSVEDARDYLFDPRSGWVYVRFWHDGKRYTRSTGVKGSIPPTAYEVKRAISEGRKIISHFALEKKKKRVDHKKSLLVGDWYLKWADELEILGRSKEYVRDIKYRWNKYLKEVFDDKDIRDITEHTWKEYALHFKKKYPGRLLQHQRTHFLAFLNHMHNVRDPATQERFLQNVPDLGMFDVPRDDVGRAATRNEQEDIIANATTKKNKLQFMMGFLMGMRPGKETCQLRKEWIHWDIDEIIIPPGKHKAGKKTKKPRIIPIHPRVKPLLREVYDETDSEYLFPSPMDPSRPISATGNRRAWNTAKRLAGIKGRLRRHDMRVTRATNNAELGVPKQLTQEVLTMTPKVLDRHYTKMDAQRRRKVYDNERE